ncbi:Abi-alpha family protein [Nocardia cyriacigeorgica]|uniref:Abi-alpha family protein n=1 Tax=Nocardia cyriacigeorgica TaxID=135487 RepID=UPI0024544FDA|nr:Abi-alpha family protein [Nocardia cyriacigeorgica]
MDVTDSAESAASSDSGEDNEPKAASAAASTEVARLFEHEPVPAARANPLTTVRTATGVVRVAWSTVTGAAGWGVGTVLDVTGTVVRRSAAGVPPAEIRAEAEAEVRRALRRALGLPETERRGGSGGTPTLREQGAALLRLSASTHTDDDGHPAFANILAEITPDEARILRYLRMDGPQPSLEVHGGRLGRLGAERLGLRQESGLTLLGEHAGLRFPNRIQHYLTNLRRLGVIELAKEPVGNPNRYQLLEAQSPVRDLLKRSGFGTKVSYRSIILTGFGEEFVQTCLPVVLHEGPAAETS